MINQRAYPDIILGFGSASQTVARYGCFMVSVLDGLNERGYNFSVYQFNELMKSRDAFVRPNLMSASRLALKIPDIFLEGRNEAWNDQKVIDYLNDKKNYIIIGEVDGRAIGGSGQHFVKLDRVDVSGGKIVMTYIDDPWDGLENQKVTTRYNRYGNILSLRVFRIKQSSGGDMPNMYKGYDLSNPDSMKVAVDILVRVQSGEFVDKHYKDDFELILGKLGLKPENSVDDVLSKLNKLNKRPSQADLDNAVKKAIEEANNNCNLEKLKFEKDLRAILEAEKAEAIKLAVAEAREQWESENPDVPSEPKSSDLESMTVVHFLKLILERLIK